MSDTASPITTPASAATPPASLSDELKAAIYAAADAHLAAVASDVAKVKGAISADLAGLATSGKSEFERLESSVLAELARLRAELSGAAPRIYLLVAGLVVVSAAAALGHFVAHLF